MEVNTVVQMHSPVWARDYYARLLAFIDGAVNAGLVEEYTEVRCEIMRIEEGEITARLTAVCGNILEYIELTFSTTQSNLGRPAITQMKFWSESKSSEIQPEI